ncbi:MmgE/PrpD family protein [Salinibacterium sp. dk2585]|uniref:MmgE/PrpD family protein n=1 Tax=unclassified Salinibacterium TaxID=2632331 RepID=UPI0011C2462A|nr:MULTISPECIES: MmgE/PrpD family protein [unclassified Salinibacterium]QEE60358.1 MmgE/PrpD family protein [Salinibacterium sp. dk2585]TXK55431.1 MmgE/PrpD family protein [Salinibacterium sp. dk5596]
MTDSTSMSEVLAAHWASLHFEDIPSVEVTRVKANILDTLAVSLAGVGTEESMRVRGALHDLHGSESGSLVWGTPDRLTPAYAAFANGTSAHARDFDDGGGPGHAGATVLPAAIAVGELVGASGRDLIAATIAGYDISYRLLQSLGGFAAMTDRGWHSTGVMGSFAAAAASAKMLGLDAQCFADALGIAGSFTGGIWAFIDDGAWTKRIHAGKAGETGVDAAFLARRGITGPHRVFEAQWGGIFATHNGGTGSPERALDRLGLDFNIDTAYIKPHACCRGSHSTIDTMLRLIEGHDLTPQNVARIIVTAGSTAINMLSVDPIETVFDAQFSLPYAIAIALHQRSVGLDQFDPPRIHEPAIRATFDRITMRLDESIQLADGPTLRIELTDGRVISSDSGSPMKAKGSASNPMSQHEVAQKARQLLAPRGPDVAEALVAAVDGLDQSEDLTDLMNALSFATERK